MDKEFDLIVIGGGPGGYVAAIRAAQLGMRVACVEKRKALGGTCLNVGCIPSKSLLEFSHHYINAKENFANYGIKANGLKVDLPQMMQQKETVISGLTAGIAGLFKKNKITLFNGLATIFKPGQVAIDYGAGKAETIKAKKILIATGSEPASLPDLTFDEKTILSSTGALSLKKIPKKMILIGAGVIGLELGSVWSRLGAEVEVIEFLDHICPGMDRELSRHFSKSLAKQGIKFHLSTAVKEVKKSATGVQIKAVSDKKNISFTGDVVLVAIGRKPYTKHLGIAEIGVEVTEKGFIKTNDKFETSVKDIYAIGDVTLGPMLAHKAEEEGVVCAEMMSGQSGHIDYNLIPSVVYTHPEIAWVGFTEEQLKEKNIAYKIGKFQMMANSRARATLESEGLVKILSCAKSDRLLGCHIMSKDAGNLIHEVAVAMEFGGSAEDLARICHAHPTLNEAIKEAALAADKRAIHS